MWLAQALADYRWREQHLPSTECISVAGVLQMAASLEAYQDARRLRFTDAERKSAADAGHCELIALNELLA